MSDPATPKTRLLVADPDLPSAVKLVRLQDALTTLLPPILEDAALVARLRELGLHRQLLGLAVYLVNEQQRRVEVTDGLAPAELDGPAAGRPERLFKEQV